MDREIIMSTVIKNGTVVTHDLTYEADVLIEEYKYDESGRQVYVFPQFNAGGAEDDAAPGSEESIVSRQKFLKSHRKRVLKEAKKLARQKRKEDRRNN